jgi:hypothetical protein
MTSESKILTVSYGTFSCTLEGFDDPFNTMKAIAEYFGELAARDRHFGAEPPPPDAAMLHRLAEREVARMAAAGKREDTALLDQGPISADADAASGPRIQINSPVRHRAARDQAATDFPADDDLASPEPALQDIIPDGVAAKLARIRQAVHPVPSAVAAPFVPFGTEPEATEPAGAEADIPEPERAELDLVEADLVEAELVEAELVEAELSEAERVEAVGDLAEVEPDVELVSKLDADEMAGDTTDLAPAVALEADMSFADAGEDGALIEAEAETTDAVAFDAEVAAEPISAVHLGDSWYEEGVTVETLELDAPAAERAEDERTAVPAEALPALAVEETKEPETALEDSLAVKVEEIDAADLDAPSADGAEDDLAAELAEELPVIVAEQAPQPETATDDVWAVEAADDLPQDDDFAEDDVALLAELDGMDFEQASLAAALDDGLPEEEPVEFDLVDAQVQDPLPEATPVDEIAAAAAQAVPEEEPVQTVGKAGGRARRLSSRVVRIHPDEDMPEAPRRRDSGATRAITSQEESDEFARLMRQAEEVMAEEENRRRQDALSHLKAAVASTEADRADVDFEAPRADASLDPYRDDLAEAIVPEPEKPTTPPVVQPRRKTVSVRLQEPRPGTIRPGMISPPPLVLVSEQRIDRVPPAATPSAAPMVPGIGPAVPEGQPMVALRTGRLSGAIGAGAAMAGSAASARNLVLEKPSYGVAVEADEDEELAEDTKEIDESGLAAFADIVGAKSMVEMLEAAAAYATCVEKRTHFTRPQLMRRMMASAGGNPVSREDGLRSFGTLLRTGRIEKVTRGHYSLAENSPYLAEARRLT